MRKYGDKIVKAEEPVHLAMDLFGNVYLCVHKYPHGGLVLMRHTVSAEKPKPLSSKSKYRIFMAPLDICITFNFEDQNLILSRIGVTKDRKVVMNSHMDKVPISCIPYKVKSIDEDLGRAIKRAWALYVDLFAN